MCTAHAKWIRTRGGHARWKHRRQRRRRHGLPALGCRERPLDPRAARSRRAHSDPLPVDAIRPGDLARRPATWRPATRSATSSSGTSNPADHWPRSRPRSSTPGTPSSGVTRSAASARWPSRPTARLLPPAAAARSRTSITWMARPRSKSSTGKRASALHAFASDKFKGLVEHLDFHPSGDWLLAAGGGDKDGFLMFFDVATAKKTLAQEKTPMYVHDLATERERRDDLCRRPSQDHGLRHERLTGRRSTGKPRGLRPEPRRLRCPEIARSHPSLQPACSGQAVMPHSAMCGM